MVLTVPKGFIRVTIDGREALVQVSKINFVFPPLKGSREAENDVAAIILRLRWRRHGRRSDDRGDRGADREVAAERSMTPVEAVWRVEKKAQR